MALNITLPVWLQADNVQKIKAAAGKWWEQLAIWAQWATTHRDIDTCDAKVLELIGWERRVDRLPSEDEALYRLRVKHALDNYKDAGTKEGLKLIFGRLGFEGIEVWDRVPNRDWDVVQVAVSDEQLATQPDLLAELARNYGRTCRRFEFSVSDKMTIDVVCADFNGDDHNVLASL
ncbi:phage tail protein [Pseudomaricurvus alkylphenolicus]|uniref:phage tail protein n=1 Tax=Pseudomaricurvus alkylphenolicus TaxID=1306991 RepID=UPI001423BF69|nr:phage tail protein [Pseudomaricurvus alkylphenolicus]NIB44768.1 phage tail protein [Pseudomaricurvus alkylphenolicus]